MGARMLGNVPEPYVAHLNLCILAANAKIVITADQGVRGGKIIELKRIVDAAVANCPNVEKVFVSPRTGGDVPMGKLDLPLETVIIYSFFIHFLKSCISFRKLWLLMKI
jgi:acyl-coenzyme A synthetase/AMP-(fatty) acid ligase